jgi:hypothetical protein
LGEQLVGTVWGDFWHGDYHKAFSMTLISVRIYLVLQGVLSDGKRKAQAQIQACCEVMPISTTFWFLPYFLIICRVGQNRIYTYIYTVYLVISKPKMPYVHHIYMVLANPTNKELGRDIAYRQERITTHDSEGKGGTLVP